MDLAFSELKLRFRGLYVFVHNRQEYPAPGQHYVLSGGFRVLAKTTVGGNEGVSGSGHTLSPTLRAA